MKHITLLFTLVATLLFGTAEAGKIKNFKLRNERIDYTPANFYITGVKDMRADTTNIGVTKIGIIGNKTTINLEGGSAAEILRFINKNMTQDLTTKPIEIHIVELKVTEESAIISEKSNLAIKFEFYSGESKLLEYSGTSSMQASYDATMYVSGMITQFIERSIKQADTWLAENKQLLAAPKVSVKVVLSQIPTDNDYIAFNINKPLKAEDFDGKPDDLSLAAGATYSNIQTAYSFERMSNKTDVLVTLTPIFDRTHSWLKKTGKNADVLSHEQIHFDITALYAGKLANAIRDFSFTADHYDDELNTLNKQYQKENEARQALYDTETKHGILKTKQKEWYDKIKSELSTSEYTHK